MSDSDVTDADIAQVLALLAINYNRPLDDEVTIAGMLQLWRTGIGGCAVEDVVAAVDLITLDEKVDRFPTVAQFRAAVIAANRRRHRVLREASPEGTVACLTCLDSGWLDMGTDDRHQWWVRACPQGCTPPLTQHRQRIATVKAGAPAKGEQLKLSRETLEAAIAGQHRTTDGSF